MNSIVDRMGRSWASLFRDVFLIVFSILVAFWLDAWWEGRREGHAVDEALQAVRLELTGARLQLDTVLARNTAAIESVKAILAADGDGPPLVTGMLYEPSTGALEALLISGLLSEVEPVELRTALAAWPGTLEELAADGENWLDVIRRLSERWAETGVASRLLAAADGRQDPVALQRDMLRDPLSRELLALEALNLEEVQAELVLSSDRLDRLLNLLGTGS